MPLISPRQVEQRYGVPSEELARWRRAGIGPQYYRITARVIRYGTDDLNEWFTDPINAHLHPLPVDGETILCPA